MAKRHFTRKLDPSGRALLNLACGTVTDPRWNNVDFSDYIPLRKHPLLASSLRKIGLLSEARYQRLQTMDPDIIRWNLARGIPFHSDSFDVVYHSHFLEHLTQSQGKSFLVECHRVLKPGGILRVVVPDLELLEAKYYKSLFGSNEEHEAAIAKLFQQMVRSECSGTEEQKPWVRRIERLIRGDASKTGELHKWMYDGKSLAPLLGSIGFCSIYRHTALSSNIENWDSYLLDHDAEGRAYKPNSLYMEARKGER